MKHIITLLIIFSSMHIHAISIEQFAKPPTYYDVKISPKGNYISIRYKYQGKLALAILDAKTKAIVGGTLFNN